MRDVEHTKERILAATGRLLARKGFSAVGVNAIAEAAGVGKPLIYRYFGGLEGLLGALGDSEEFWPPPAELLEGTESIRGGYAETVAHGLLRLGAALRRRPKTLAILAWQLVESNALTRAVEGALARMGQAYFTRVRAARGAPPAGVDAAAINAVLIAGLFLLAMRAQRAGEFAGLSLRTPEDWLRVDSAVAHLAHAALGTPRTSP